MPFELSLNGATYRTDSLTLDEAERLETECGKTWLKLNPALSAKEFKATARVFLARDHAPADVDRLVSAMTVGTAMQAVAWVEDDLPTMFEDGLPKAAAGNSTGTSSASPSLPTAGLPT
jgi:hypothetical protein